MENQEYYFRILRKEDMIERLLKVTDAQEESVFLFCARQTGLLMAYILSKPEDLHTVMGTKKPTPIVMEWAFELSKRRWRKKDDY